MPLRKKNENNGDNQNEESLPHAKISLPQNIIWIQLLPMSYNIAQGMNKAPFLAYPEFFFSEHVNWVFSKLLFFFSSFPTTPFPQNESL